MPPMFAPDELPLPASAAGAGWSAQANETLANLTVPEGGVLLGLGCDVIEIERVAEVISRQGARFLGRVFTAEERAYCESLRYSARSYAARFAAKEAVAKAFGTGIGAELSWQSVAIYHGSRQEPRVRLDLQGQKLLKVFQGTGVLISISHSDAVAMAVAAIVRVA